MYQNKKGLSPVIASVLIIMITIVAVAVIAGFLVPFVQNSLQKSSECLQYESYYSFDESFGYNCYDGVEYKISIKSSSDSSLAENIEGIKLILNEKSGANRVLDIRNNISGSVEEGKLSIAGEPGSNLKMPISGGIITYVYYAQPDNNYISAEVYPVLNNGRICANQKELINIKPC